jgi:hypothetical protein
MGGSANLIGDALIEFASGQISTIAGNIVLGGTRTFVADASDLTHNSALAALQSISGGLTLQGGSTVTTTGALSVTGTLTLQGGSMLVVAGPVTAGNATFNFDASSALTITGGNSFTQTGGNLTVNGTLSAALIDVAGGKLDLTKAITGDTFEVGGDGVLELSNSMRPRA